jgi:hypothetical protein
MTEMSRDWRRLAASRARLARSRLPGPSGRSSPSEELRAKADADAVERQLLTYLEKKTKTWAEADRVGPLAQMLQVEGRSVRSQLIKMLQASEAPGATSVLVQRAVFDLSAEVRGEAIAALKKRPLATVRPLLLAALRYPWPPAAAHAAEALVELDDRAAVAPLKALLDQPDPRSPYLTKDKKIVVTEVVRVNHLRNCLMCHAPSRQTSDPARGLVPTPGQPIPEVYYSSTRGDFVRADVTYLRQDFSAMQKVAEPDRWPVMQRYDYLLRTRDLSAAERALLPAPRRPAMDASPYQAAVRFALRHLSEDRPSKP